MGSFIRGLPIGVMALLDKYTNKGWCEFFDSRVRSYLSSGDWRTQFQAWPFALRDTLAQFNITDPTLNTIVAKFIEVTNKKIASMKRKRGPTNLMAGGSFANIFTMVVISFITMGVASAAMALIAEAVVAAEIATAAEFAAVAETAQQAQTVYSVVHELQSDNPNLFGLASSLLSLNESFGIFGADVDGAVAYDYSFDAIEPVAVGGDQMAFDYSGDNLAALDLTDATDLTGGMIDEAMLEIDFDHDYSGVNFAGVAADEMQAAVESIVANLDQYAGDPNALYAAIEQEAATVANNVANTVEAVVEQTYQVEIEAGIEEVAVADATVAAQTDMGNLTVDELDMTALEEGWTEAEATGMDYEQAVETESPTPSPEQLAEVGLELSMEDIQTVLEVGAKIAAVVEPIVVLPPPPPPPPPTPAQIVTAPAPDQPLPGPVATVQPTMIPDYTAALLPDGYGDIPLTTASFGPIAPDGEKGFNLWWLLPLGLLAIPLAGKQKRKRK